jgi:hypothetical protein
MKDAKRLMAIILGVLGAAATVDAKLQQATDTSGTGAKDISGKAITQLVKASNDNNEASSTSRTTSSTSRTASTPCACRSPSAPRRA